MSLGRDLRRGGEGRENRNKQLRRKDFGILSGCNENKKKIYTLDFNRAVLTSSSVLNILELDALLII